MQQRRLCPQCSDLQIPIASALGPLRALQATSAAHSERLHVYLEGDGRPWNRWNSPTANPSSRNLTALKLMQLDPSDRVYLNRPCYGSATLNDACAPRFWTGARYSETVIAAMDQALDALVQQLRAQQLVLIGHSGGGSIAMLLAQRREDVVGVITLAANLDHRMWTDSFEYLPLSGSLNASEVVLPSSTLRWHFAGARDRQVPAAQTVAAAKRDPHARVELIAEFDHHCCWARRWPAILRQLQTALADTAAAVFTAKEQNKTPRLHDPLRAPASSPAPVQYR